MGSAFFRTGQTRANQLAVLRQKQYLPRPARGGGQVLFCRGPWPGLEGAALCRRSVFVGHAMKDALLAYVKRVQAVHDRVKGNEQATKQSLIGPLFTLLGYDLT